VLPNVPWDIQINAVSQKKILTNFQAANQKNEYVFIQWHKPADTHIVIESLKDNGFQQPQHFFWHKTEHLTQTPPAQMVSTVEMATLAFKPSSDKCTKNMPMDPRKRHNFIECKAVTTYLRDSNNQVLNPCQKPPQLAEWYIGMYCEPGAWVLVIGGGAGGEVRGALNAGCNVVAVESDKRQFDGLCTNFTKWAQQKAAEIEKANKQGSNSTSKKGKSSSSSSTSSQNAVLDALVAGQEKETCIDCGGHWTAEDPRVATQVCLLCKTGLPFHAACCTKQDDGTFLCPTHVPPKEATETHSSTAGK
jgi:hypothetical protein